MKAVLISIKPKWCDLIRRGRKTVEVRKTCPKLEVPFKVYIYETMDGGRGSGLVFGEFVCIGFDVFRPIGKGISIKRFPALYESCLTLDEIVKYAQGEPVYGWKISQLKLYEEPLNESDINAAINAISDADLLIIGGTSLAVQPAAGLIRFFNGRRLAVINKSPTSADDEADIVINGSIGETLGSITVNS